ncbi:Fic/DOC family protein [Gordonia rubripertincta]|uniref:protein adenylyltransferase n=1 Tax=Gordonia rubripertincta TaxID=36822 RepID=A0ABT4N3N6_GORRU|nr:Fic family protein [Gordonia rubripertincta]MCZ4553659.1 Fic family protein [Gordonia rubripertincta]
MHFDDYFWPGTRVLANKLDHHNNEDLHDEEYIWTSAREQLIRAGTADIDQTFDAEHLRQLHRYLFQDVYEWAGRYREVNFGKDDKPFAHINDIDYFLGEATRTIDATPWAELTREEFVEQSSRIYADINHAHPFREGNGRTAKLFMSQLAEHSGYDYHFHAIDPYAWNLGSALSRPVRGKFDTLPDMLHPVFDAITVERPQPAAATTQPDAEHHRELHYDQHPEPLGYQQHPEPPTYNQHPEIPYRHYGPGPEGPGHHRGMSR